jgi:hypothetical protein
MQHGAVMRKKDHDTIRTRCRAVAALGCLALLLPLILCGCGQKRQWTKDGLSQAAFDQDAAHCRKEASRASYQTPFAKTSELEYSVAQERFFERCMLAKGYRLEKDPSRR